MIMQTIWPDNIDEAREMQERDKLLLRIAAVRREPAYVAGVDAAFDEDAVYAAACLFRYPEMTLIEEAGVTGRRRFPYVPGYLLFLEGPVIMDALRRLKKAPDVILVDGQGIAHPRGIGSASHLGVLLDVPTIGCAKTRLLGHHREPDRRREAGHHSSMRGRRSVLPFGPGTMCGRSSSLPGTGWTLRAR